VHCKAQYRELALINHRQSSNLVFQTLFLGANVADLTAYFGNIAKFICQFLVLRESVVLC